jgi:zinc protease
MKLSALVLSIFISTISVLHAEDLPLTELKTPHGVRFSFFKSDVQNTVAVALAFKGGVASDATGDATGFLAPGLMMAGAGGKTASELYEALQDFGGGVSLTSNADQTYGLLSAPLKGIMGAAKIANLVLTRPDFPEQKLLQRREALAQRLEEYSVYPDAKMQVAFAAAAAWPHVYDNYNNPSPQSVRNVSRATMAPWAARHITKDGIIVSVVGNLSNEDAASLVDQLLDGLPEKSDITATPKMVFKAAPTAPIILNLQTGDQALLTMGTAYAFNYNLKDWIAATMLSAIFAGDQKTRLFKDIRESTGATYGLQPSFNFNEMALGNAVMGRIAKAEIEKTTALVKKSWDNFRVGGPTDDEITNAKVNMQHYLGDLGRNHYAMAGFVRDYMTGHWTTAQIAKLPELVEASNLKDKALLTKLFPETPIIVIAQ